MSECQEIYEEPRSQRGCVGSVANIFYLLDTNVPATVLGTGIHTAVIKTVKYCCPHGTDA